MGHGIIGLLVRVSFGLSTTSACADICFLCVYVCLCVCCRDVSENALSGSLPPFTEMPALQYLYVSRLSVCLYVGRYELMVAGLCVCSNASGNAISGSVPASLFADKLSFMCALMKHVPNLF